MRFSSFIHIPIIFGLLVPVYAAAQSPQAPGSSELATTLDAFSSFSLAEAGRHLKDRTLSIEHLTLTIADATATPIHARDGSIAGLWITGMGGWTYKTEVQSERAVLATNKSRIAPTLPTTPESARDTFRTMIVLFGEPLWADAWDSASGATGAEEPPPPGAAAEVEDALKLIRAHYSTEEIDFRLAQARLNHGGRYVYMEFMGGAARTGYVLDEVADRFEGICGFRYISNYKARFLETLAAHESSEPGPTKGVWVRYRHVGIDVATADNQRGTIASDLDMHLQGPAGGRVLEFALSNSQDPDSPDWNSKTNRLVVTRVLDSQGRELPFAHRYDRLLVQIPPLDGAEADLKIRVETEGEIFLDWKRHHSDNFFALLGRWWPQPTRTRGSEHVSFDLKVRTKAPWRAVTSGNEVALREGPGWIETESHADRSSFHIYVLGGKYVTHEETVDGRKIRIHGYAMARSNVIENMPKLAGAIIRFYSGALGPMAADELDIVEVPEYGFGIAPFGMALLTSEAFKPRQMMNVDQYSLDPLRQDEVKDRIVRGINGRLAHEIAHQWFGNKAFPATEEDDWISETLAEYWSGLAIAAMAGQKKGIEGFPEMLAGWRGEAANCESTGPITSVNVTGGEQWFRDRYCLLYHRGPLVMHMLRTLIGDDRFVSSSKLFLDRAELGPATSDDFAKAVTDTVHTDLGWIVDDWIRQGGTPDLRVDYKISGTGDAKRLTGTIAESGDGGFKHLYVPFIVDAGGHSEVRLVFVDKPQTAFDVPLPASARGVKVDPGRNNLVKYR
jgi:hypothetical protein